MKTTEESLNDIADSLAKLCGRVSMAVERDAANGLMLRDKFAIAALPAVMNAISATPTEHQPPTQGRVNTLTAKVAYRIADAMMKERMEQPKQLKDAA